MLECDHSTTVINLLLTLVSVSCSYKDKNRDRCTSLQFSSFVCQRYWGLFFGLLLVAAVDTKLLKYVFGPCKLFSLVITLLGFRVSRNES